MEGRVVILTACIVSRHKFRMFAKDTIGSPFWKLLSTPCLPRSLSVSPIRDLMISEQVPNPDQNQWFRNEVLPHEPSLRTYLRCSFPAIRDIDDMVQESYLRIWRARLARPVSSAKSFLFQIARHLAIDAIRRTASTRLDSQVDIGDLLIADSGPNAAEALGSHEVIDLLAQALAAMPRRRREVVVLRRLRLLSQKQVAAQLGISERTVESQLARGMRFCEAYLRKRGASSSYSDER